MKIIKFFKENDVDWINFAFIAGTPVVAILGLVFCLSRGVPTATWVLTLVLTMLTGLGVTAGYHRLFSHRSYQAAWPVRLAFLILGAASFQNSAIKWSADHRDHHQFVDTDRDPYNIKKGFWYAHLLWVILRSPFKRDFDNVKDLQADAILRFQHRYYLPLAIGSCFILPMGIAALWGDPWGGFFIAGFLRVVFNHHMAFCINSVCHYVGNQPYSSKDTSRDSWFVSLFTYGEGFHNFHHTFSADYRNGVKAYHWDPAKWLIWVLQFLGLTWNLKRVPQKTRLVSRIRADESKLLSQLQIKKLEAVHDVKEMIRVTREKFEHASVHFYELKQEYEKIKKEKLDAWNERIIHLKRDVKLARKNFRDAANAWKELCGRREWGRLVPS